MKNEGLVLHARIILVHRCGGIEVEACATKDIHRLAFQAITPSIRCLDRNMIAKCPDSYTELACNGTLPTAMHDSPALPVAYLTHLKAGSELRM
jgi:hypothetical protein